MSMTWRAIYARPYFTAENQQLVSKHLPPDLYEYLDASILSQTSPEEAYRKYDELASKHVEQLRKLTKQIQARPGFIPELRFTLGITVLIPASSA